MSNIVNKVLGEAEDSENSLMHPIRIFVPAHGDYWASTGPFGLPVFSHDPGSLAKQFPGATIVEFICNPVRVIPPEENRK